MLGDSVGVSAVLAAMLGLSVLLLTGVLTWKDCLTYPAAWDTLFWFAILVGAPFSGSSSQLTVSPSSVTLVASAAIRWDWRPSKLGSFAAPG